VGLLCWHGWRLELPEGWDPVRLEGDFAAGYVLLADLHRPRLGMKWETLSRRKLDVTKLVHGALKDEVGVLAADEAEEKNLGEQWQGGRLYTERNPPGRDVLVGYSTTSRRLLQVVYHVPKDGRDRIFAESILPTLADESDDAVQKWSIFELSCRAPRELGLQSQRLLAGDLSLNFASDSRRERLTVRQIAVAQLALQRTKLDQWLRRQQSLSRKHYRPEKLQEPIEVITDDGRRIIGLRGPMHRRRRFFFLRKLPREQVTYAMHDEARDRIAIVQSSDEDAAQAALKSVGWAQVRPPQLASA
jgi:hypothetical protein